MKILIIGSGGREHALAWKISQSRLVKKIFIAPGNAGTLQHGENIPIKSDDILGLKKFALKEKIDLTVVGPELPLTLGIVDEFQKEGLKIFGPSKRASRLEGSKMFGKDLMEKYRIPTARYAKFTDADRGTSYVKNQPLPVVIKADGLASGKGVVICPTHEEANAAIDEIMTKKSFGPAGNAIVIEEFLQGEEVSMLAVTDGKTILPLAPAQDHKKIFEGDKGPNTGGMGAYSPTPLMTKELEEKISSTIMFPTVRAMEKEKSPYMGILYAGLMLTKDGPKVLEFNCRFGDPETQPILMRLKSDLVEVMLACIKGRLDNVKLSWDPRPSVCVVMASKGYPGDYEKGKPISGLKEAAKVKDVMVFHAGTVLKNGKTVTDGGRVLGVTALGDNIKDAIKTAYGAVGKISWQGAYYRKDIAKKALNLECPAP